VLGAGLNISAADGPFLLKRFYVWTQSFHTISFFGISGLVWSGAALGFGAYSLKCARSLLLPYVLFGIVSLLTVGLTSTVLVSDYSLGVDLITFLSFGEPRFNRPLWFLPCLFMVMMAYYGISQIAKKWRQKVVAIIVIAGVWVFMPGLSGCTLPFSMNLLPIFLLAFAMWNLIRGVVVGAYDMMHRNSLRIVWMAVGVGLMVFMLHHAYYGEDSLVF